MARAAAGDQKSDARVLPVQLRGDLHQFPGNQGRLLVQTAHMADNKVLPQGEFPADGTAGNGGRKLLRVDAVDGDRDMFRRDVVFLLQVIPDVLRNCQGSLAPVGEHPQCAADLVDAMAGGHKGKVHRLCQLSTEHGRNAGVGMNDIRLFPGNDPLEDLPGLQHLPYRPTVEGRIVMLCACFFDLRDIDAAIGDHNDLVSLPAQFFRQLYDMGLGAADVQRHRRHQDFHKLFSF